MDLWCNSILLDTDDRELVNYKFYQENISKIKTVGKQRMTNTKEREKTCRIK